MLIFMVVGLSASLCQQVETGVLQLLPSLDVAPVGVEGLRIFLLLNELLHEIKRRKGPNNTKLAEAVAAAMQRLSAESLQIIGTLNVYEEHVMARQLGGGPYFV